MKPRKRRNAHENHKLVIRTILRNNLDPFQLCHLDGQPKNCSVPQYFTKFQQSAIKFNSDDESTPYHKHRYLSR